MYNLTDNFNVLSHRTTQVTDGVYITAYCSNTAQLLHVMKQPEVKTVFVVGTRLGQANVKSLVTKSDVKARLTDRTRQRLVNVRAAYANGVLLIDARNYKRQLFCIKG